MSPHNLLGAWRDFARGKRRRPDVDAFAVDAERHVLQLAEDLGSGRYRHGPYRLLRISDPKRRLIAAATVRDRVVHHAIHRVLAPRLSRSFIDHSYACLAERGSHRAVLRFRQAMRQHRHVMQLDVRRYFYSVDRAVLRDLLHHRLREQAMRDLINHILDSGAGLYRDPAVAAWLGWAQPGPPGRGLPIGNLTSQWWGNLYLDALDHRACRVLRIPYVQRYMDDVALFADDAGTLLAAREDIAEWLSAHRGLTLKDPDARPKRTKGWHGYLGYRVSRVGIEPGDKMRVRLPEVVARAADRSGPNADAARKATASALTACWMFG